MKRFKTFQKAAAGIATLGLLLPQAAKAVEPVVAPAAVTSPAQATAVIDVALLAGGALQGQVVDAAGAPVADTTVTIAVSGQTVATAQTDARGYFTAANLRGGMYQISAAGGTGVYRLWAPNSAPPAANSGVLIVSSEQVARGQVFKGSRRGALVMLGLLGGIVAAGLIAEHTHRSGS